MVSGSDSPLRLIPMNAYDNIRLALTQELHALQRIEIAAGERFRGVGLAEVADGEPLSRKALQACLDNSLLWSATNDGDQPVGFLAAEALSASLHIVEVSVHPDFGRRGIGRSLINVAIKEARKCGYTRVTLSTFRKIPWNAPFYAKLGFQLLDKHDLNSELLIIRQSEIDAGMPIKERVFMQYQIGQIADESY